MARFSLRGDGTVQIDTSDLDEALAAIHDAGAELAGNLMQVGAEILVAEVLEVFEQEGAVGGHGRWPEFAWERDGLPRPQGRRWQGNLKLLQDTGVLVGSITPYAEQGVAEAFSNVPYAGYHVSRRPRKKIPLRDFTLIDFDKAQREFADVILAQLDASAARP